MGRETTANSLRPEGAVSPENGAILSHSHLAWKDSSGLHFNGLQARLGRDRASTELHTGNGVIRSMSPETFSVTGLKLCSDPEGST